MDLFQINVIFDFLLINESWKKYIRFHKNIEQHYF